MDSDSGSDSDSDDELQLLLVAAAAATGGGSGFLRDLGSFLSIFLLGFWLVVACFSFLTLLIFAIDENAPRVLRRKQMVQLLSSFDYEFSEIDKEEEKTECWVVLLLTG